MKRLTKKEALEICIRHWEQLAKMGRPIDIVHQKAQALLLADLPGPLRSFCACCHYDGQFDSTCRKCPIWPRSTGGFISGCCKGDSPYQAWKEALSDRHANFWAQEVANLARKKLEELKGGAV